MRALQLHCLVTSQPGTEWHLRSGNQLVQIMDVRPEAVLGI